MAGYKILNEGLKVKIRKPMSSRLPEAERMINAVRKKQKTYLTQMLK